MKRVVGGNVTSVGAIGSGDLTNDVWGTLQTSTALSLVHGMWTFDIPVKTWFMYENGAQVYTSTAIASIGGAGTLTTNAVETSLILESRECPMYQPNRGHRFASALVAPDKTNDGERDWGFGTQENRALFRLKSDGLLYAVIRSGDVQTHEEPISVPDGFNVETGHLYDIRFQWRGVGGYFFFIDLELVHTVEFLGITTKLSIENPAMPIRFECTRATQDVTLTIGCADISSEGGRIESHQYESAYAEAVATNTDTPIMVIHNPLQIDGKTNTRTVQFARVTVTCSKKAVFKVWTTRDPSSMTGGTLQTINNGSYIQTDSPDMDAASVRTTSVDTTKLNFVTAVQVEGLNREVTNNPLREKIIFPIVRGDYLLVTGKATSGASDCVIEWGEQI